MTKQDVLDALDAKFAAVLRLKEKDDLGGVSWWIANVLEITGDSANRRNVDFYVIDEGEPSERAYWHGGEPNPAPLPPTFEDELTVWLDGKVAADQILFYSIVRTLPTIERAQVDVMLGKKQVTPSDIVQRSIGVYRDQQGDFQYETVT